jgi:hypothetical protein
MAEVVDELPGPARGASIHSWEEWLDGRVWKLTHGVDFEVSMKAFATQAWSAGKRLGVKVATRRQGNVIYIQASKPTC